VILAAVGLYTVTAHAVIQRTPEIGIRMALGAQTPDVVWMVLRQASVQLGLGFLAGACCAVGWEKLFRPTNEFERVADPVTLVAVAGLLAGVATIACLSPTRRATRVDPVVALRYE
jgi:ABC-type antimicrobial peptide transport system permease subunit